MKNAEIEKVNKEFQEAIKREDIQKVEELFNQNVIPHINQDIITAPAIVIAAQQNNWKMVELLYSLDADLDVGLQPENWTLLHLCIAAPAPDYVTKTLIEYCNLKQTTDEGENYLMTAIRTGKIEMAQHLLNLNQIDLSMSDKNLDTAAHYAAKMGYNEFLLELIEKGAPVLQRNKRLKTPIDFIEDDAFRMRLPEEIQGMVDKGRDIVLEKDDSLNKSVTPIKSDEIKPINPMISGLSVIKKLL